MAARNTGALPVSARALTVCNMHVFRAAREQMLAPAKARIGRGWDLVSRIGNITTHRMAARKLGALSISARALAMQGACQEWMQFSNQSSDA